jgi:hypothetical protein
VGLAYALDGEGAPLVKVGNWMTHLDYERQSPVWRHWVRELSRRRTLVRYDVRGQVVVPRQLDLHPQRGRGAEALVRRHAAGLEHR